MLETNKGDIFEAALYQIGDKTVDKFQFKNKEDADIVLEESRGADFIISEIERKEVKKNPLPPFITSTLQQAASTRLGFSAKKTMFMAQHLYENGFITYMRTDSTNLSNEALASAKDWLEKEFGGEYAQQAPRIFTTKSRLAQEAHEAIRPTDISRIPKRNKEDSGEGRLYELIWSRFLSSQMPQAVFDSTHINIQSGNYKFRASGIILKFDGFLKVWKQSSEDKILPELSEKEKLRAKEFIPEQHFTEPSPRYTEASLIKTLEEYGIGRPSTYAPIISVIQGRHYVEKEGGKFHPTEMGLLVNRVLIENFPQIVDLGFTVKMEEDLDNVADGQKDWRGIIKDFYGPFSDNLKKKYEEVSKSDLIAQEVVNEKCEKCGKPLTVKYSRFGKFLACTGFPECRNTKQIKTEPKKIGLKCPWCKEGELVERRVSRGRARGRIFWGCGRYPKCDFAVWENPLKPSVEKKEQPENPEKEASN